MDASRKSPHLPEVLYALLHRAELPPSELAAELERLEASYGEVVYAQLIFLLCHLELEGEEAKRCWREIVAHHQSLEQRLASSVDLRVALASYFLQVNRKLENPKIIELRLFEATQASAYRDELTGLYNYRFFSESLRCELAAAERSGSPLSLVMVDVDDFKAYNDRNGHEAGSAALRSVAQVLAGNLPEADIAARYGGEEFALILPSTPKRDALVVAERIRAAIEQHEFPHEEDQPDGTLTVSMGVATFPGDARESAELLRRADRALYAAKAAGKNQVQLFGQSLRSFQRVEAEVPGTFQLLQSQSVSLTCVDLSEGGLNFLTAHRLERDALIHVTLELPAPHGEVSLTARVVRLTAADSRHYLVACRVLDVDADSRHRLASHVRQVEARSAAT